MRLKPILLAFFILTLAQAQAFGQDTAFADTELYDSVLDHLFQYEPQARTPEMQLRYTACAQGEMQILVRSNENNQVYLQIWRLPPNSPTIWVQLAKLVTTNPDLGPSQAAGLIKLRKQFITVAKSATLEKIIERGRALSVPLAGDSGITLDGMDYELVVRSLSANIAVTLQGPQRAQDSQNLVIRWMGELRDEVEKQADGIRPDAKKL